MNNNTVALVTSLDDISDGRLYLLDKESLSIKSRLPTCVHPIQVWLLSTLKVLLIHCKGYGFSLKDTIERRASLQIVVESNGDYHNIDTLPLDSGVNSYPLSHEVSLVYVLHNGMVLYVHRDGRQLSLATVSPTRIEHVLSHNSSSLGCLGKFTAIVQTDVTNDVYLSCTHTKRPNIIRIRVGVNPTYLDFVSVVGIRGKLVKSPVVDGNEQYIAAVDQAKGETSFLLVFPGGTRKLPTVATDFAIVKDPCVFVSTEHDAKFYCVLLGRDELYFISMQKLQEGNTEFFPCGVKLTDGVDTVTSTSDGKILIQGGKEGSQIIIIDPVSDTTVSSLIVPPKSKILQPAASTTIKTPMIKQLEPDTTLRLTTPSTPKASASSAKGVATIEVPTTLKVSTRMTQCREETKKEDLFLIVEYLLDAIQKSIAGTISNMTPNDDDVDLETSSKRWKPVVSMPPILDINEVRGQNNGVVTDKGLIFTVGGLRVSSRCVFVIAVSMWCVWWRD